MENEIYGSRNTSGEESEYAPAASPTWISRRQAKSPNWGKPRSSLHSPGIENSPVLTKRARAHEVEGAIGTGHPKMPAEDIIRGLTRLGRKPPRTATVREMGGVPVVLCSSIPTGMSAFRTAAGVNAFSLETGALIITVPVSVQDPPVSIAAL